MNIPVIIRTGSPGVEAKERETAVRVYANSCDSISECVMEECKICIEPCRGCGLDPHDPRCGICGSLHKDNQQHEPPGIKCHRCGRMVHRDRLLYYTTQNNLMT